MSDSKDAKKVLATLTAGNVEIARALADFRAVMEQVCSAADSLSRTLSQYRPPRH